MSSLRGRLGTSILHDCFRLKATTIATFVLFNCCVKLLCYCPREKLRGATFNFCYFTQVLLSEFPRRCRLCFSYASSTFTIPTLLHVEIYLSPHRSPVIGMCISVYFKSSKWNFSECPLKGPLTDLFEPLLRKIDSHITSSFLVSSELFYVF